MRRQGGKGEGAEEQVVSAWYNMQRAYFAR